MCGVAPNSSKRTEGEKSLLLLKESRRKTIRSRKMRRQQKGEREERVKRQKREVCLLLLLLQDSISPRSKSSPGVLCKGFAYSEGRLLKPCRFHNSVSAERTRADLPPRTLRKGARHLPETGTTKARCFRTSAENDDSQRADTDLPKSWAYCLVTVVVEV